MRRPYPALFLPLALVLLCGHDMFLKPGRYFLAAESGAEIALVNGTFSASENVIDRGRMVDVSVVSGGRRERVDTTQWSERGETTYLALETGAPGTYVVGVSTRARSIEMDAEAFNDYLRHEGGVDMLAERERDGVLGDAATERYSKHVKTVVQVGDARTADYATALDYPIEFVPVSNPYELHPGDELPVRLLLRGAPLANQVVLLGREGAAHGHSHAHEEHHGRDDDHVDEPHTHDAGVQVRTDAAGVVTVPVPGDGVYHLRTIHLTTVDEPGLTHESNWATLTFEVSHARSHAAGGHAHGDHEHDGHEHGAHTHTNEHEGGLPTYAFWLGSLAVVGALFLFFRKGNS